jgi:peroxiredoxin
VLLSRGDRRVHRRLADQHHWKFDVLLEDAWTVASTYQTNATPTAYLVDAQGRIASSLAIGAPGIEELVKVNGHDLTVESIHEKEQAAQERARAAGLSVRESTIQRDGLEAGAVAPNFTLPSVRGGEQTLADYRGKRVLLVFSDPGCGPCQTLAPQLEQLHRNAGRTKLHVLMVSRGDLAANTAKAQEHGLTFPVLLQNSWEVSRQYGMFATPLGYLIDESGVIAKDVAVGAEAVMALAGS